MEWLLIITILGGADRADVRAGHLATAPLCQMAGMGIAAAITEQVPQVDVRWTCVPGGAV